MKKVLAVLLATVFALSLMTCGAVASVSAQTVTVAPYSGDPVYSTFALYDAYGLPGGEITVPLYIENNPGIVTFQWDLTYDPEYLELISVEEQIFAGLTYSALDVAPLSIEWTAQENVNNYENGVVAYAGNEIKGMGNLVIVQHSDGWMTVYAHMDTMNVRRGARVKVGDKIGTVGQTGKVDSPQLHFEIRKGTKAYNPSSYLKN